MFSKYSGEQINQIPEGYVQAMGQSPIAALISSGLQGYQMGTQMQMAQTKMGLEERSVAAGEKSATAAAAKANTDEAKYALLTEDTFQKGQAALDEAKLKGDKLAFDYTKTAHDGFTEEQGELVKKLGLLQGTPAYQKNDKIAKDAEAEIQRRQITVATRLRELNDKLAQGATSSTPREIYRLPANVSLPPNDPLGKRYTESQEEMVFNNENWNKYTDWNRPLMLPKPNTPLQQAEKFKKSLTPDDLRRMNMYSNPFGNR